MEGQPEQKEELLQEFKRNNPHCRVIVEDGRVVIDSPWGYVNNRLTFAISETDLIQDLDHVAMRPEFDAIYHLDHNMVEFVFAYLSPDDAIPKEYVNRHFVFCFDGAQYDCSFSEPTQRVYQLAKHLTYLPDEKAVRVIPQLREFRDVQRLESLPDAAKRYFEGKVPRSFFIKPSAPIMQVDLSSVARHLNFLTSYYDRRSPVITIRDEEESNHEPKLARPVRLIQGEFPPALTLRPIDDMVLRLIEVARGSPHRFAFLYYYQVLEYYGFHFMEHKTTAAMRRLLRDPAILSCSSERAEEFLGVMTELQLSDDAKIQKVVAECCDPRTLWMEISQHKEAFASKVSFDGGFQLPPLISDDMTEKAWCSAWSQTLPAQLRDIRNHLVHARERRQSLVILPTKSNDRLIAKYVFLIARVCEQVAVYNT